MNSLKDDKNFVKGIFQQAEALYAMGDFETALLMYHRGHKKQPEISDFRLGIQKATEAINNSIGSKCDEFYFKFNLLLTEKELH